MSRDFFSIAEQGAFPRVRPRRVRAYPWARDLAAETSLQATQLILPVFVLDGINREEAVTTMPGVVRQSIDRLIPRLQAAHQLGIGLVALFPVIDVALKTPDGGEALNPNGLVPRTVRAIREAIPTLGVMVDIALDPYTSHGQDGLLSPEGEILNDETVEVLVQQGLCYARAGAQVLAPSDMMDGRIGALREGLEASGHSQTLIISYAAKYASSFYGPFRDAVGSAAQLGAADKKTYQMDIRNGAESIREVSLDLAEGADLVMVKPGLPYLDVIQRITAAFEIPCLAYQVSGEYAMIHAAAAAGMIDGDRVMMESLISLRRAGATGILTYAAERVALQLQRT